MNKSDTKINISNLSKNFQLVKDKYDKLGLNLVQAIELFLNGKDIKYLSVTFRVKEESSFIEKIERKKYKEPFLQTEDLCGLRIICFYQSDVEKIAAIISEELEVLHNQDKEELLQADQFGYRSTHLIVKIKENWLQDPNYRGLENLKAEIQIRTVLMHAWAEIEHKLAYKRKEHIPKHLVRKLHRISAKLEEADEHFEEIQNEALDYKENVIGQTKSNQPVRLNFELNLDSLQAFLDVKLPNRDKDINSTRELLDEFLKYKISLNDVIKAFEKSEKYIRNMETENFLLHDIIDPAEIWTQVGLIRNIMDLVNEDYFNSRFGSSDVKFIEFKQKWKDIIFNI